MRDRLKFGSVATEGDDVVKRRVRDWRERAPADERRSREESGRCRAWLIQDDACRLGLSMVVSHPHPDASHWRFGSGKRVVAEYWPTTEKFLHYIGRRRDIPVREVVPLDGLVERLTDLCPGARLDRECDALLAQSYT